MGTIKVPAWLIDSDGDGVETGAEMGVWLLLGLDPAGTWMAVYGLAETMTDVAGRIDPSPEAVVRLTGVYVKRLLAIEDAHGIELRGPEIELESPLADALAKR
jgi:hypothetical protein